MTKTSPTHYPQIIVGAGYVGCLLALLLHRAGQSVLVIEKSGSKIRSDDRHFGLTKETRLILEELGLWKTLSAQSTDIRAMRIFIADDESTPFLSLQNSRGVPVGRMIPAADLQRVLREALLEAGVDIVYNTEIVAVRNTHASVTIETAAGESYSTVLLVAADGMHSPSREFAGIAVRQKELAQQAQQWKIVHHEPHEGIAYEILLPEGPFVVLPGGDAYTSKLVWCCDENRASDDETALREHFPASLGEISLLEYIGRYRLTEQKAESPYRGRIVLVGDAYQRVHPVAAQGLNLGLRDAMALSRMLIDAEYLGLDRGSPQMLRSFAKSRQWDRFTVRHLTRLLGRKSDGNAPYLRTPKRLLGKILATAPAKHLIRRAFHGE